MAPVALPSHAITLIAPGVEGGRAIASGQQSFNARGAYSRVLI